MIACTGEVDPTEADIVDLWVNHGLSKSALHAVGKTIDKALGNAGVPVDRRPTRNPARLKRVAMATFNELVCVPLYAVSVCSSVVLRFVQARSSLYTIEECTIPLDSLPYSPSRNDAVVFRFCDPIAAAIRLYANDELAGVPDCLCIQVGLSPCWSRCLLCAVYCLRPE